MGTRRPRVLGSRHFERLAGVTLHRPSKTPVIPRTRTHNQPDPEDDKLNALTRFRAALLRATLKLRRKRQVDPPAES